MKSVDQLMMFGHFDLIESAHMVGFQDPKTRSVSQVTGSYGLQNDSEGVSQHQRARGNRKNGQTCKETHGIPGSDKILAKNFALALVKIWVGFQSHDKLMVYILSCADEK